MKALSAWFAASAALVAVAGPAAAQSQIRFAHMNGAQHPVHLGALKLKEAVERRTDKKVTVDVFPGGQLGENTAVGEQISLGSAMIGQIGNGVLADYVPDFSVLVYPFLFKDWAQARTFLTGPLVKSMEKKIEANNIKVLCYINFGTRDLYTRAKPVRTPADTAGLKLRVQPVAIYTEMVKSMGATPTPMPWPEVYSALSQGVIDAAEAPPNAIIDQKQYEHAKFYMKTNHIVDVSPIAMSLAAYNRLSPEHRKVVDEESQASCDYISDETSKGYAASVQVLKDRGMTIIEDVDRAAFAKRAEDVQKAFPKWSPNLLAQVKAAVGPN